MNLRSKTFCVLPWIEKFENINGSRYLCCHSKVPINEDEKDLLRTKIFNQEPIPHCESCYRLDRQLVISPRLEETARWLKNPKVKSYIDNWKPGDKEQTFFYHLLYDNKCNLACISCTPMYSSLWAKELGVKIKPHTPAFDNKDIVSSAKVYIAGGEPLINEQFLSLLEQISHSDQQPEVVINTNLTRVNSDIQKVLQRVKNLTLIVSVDAYEKVNEYHRWPMKWTKFIDNLNWARSIKCTVQFNTVIDAVSIVNAAELVEIETQCDFWNLSVLTSPKPLLINNLPEDKRDQVRHSWEKIKTSKFFVSDPVFKSRAMHVFDLLNQPGHSELLANYIAELDQRRQIDHQQYLGIKLT